MEPSCKTKTIEDLAESSHAKEKTKHTWEYIRHLVS